MNGKITLTLVVVGALLIAISQSLFIVDQAQQAIVLQLGQPVGELRKPGLHLKLPMIQDVRYFDRRILSVDPTPKQMVIASSTITRPAIKTEEPEAAEETAEGETPSVVEKRDEIVIPPIDNVSGEPIIVDSYARYKIVDPLQFLKTLRSVDNADKRIESIIVRQQFQISFFAQTDCKRCSSISNISR